MQDILEKQNEYFYSNQFKPSYQTRISFLNRLQEAIKKYEDDILEALQLDCGKPEIEAFLSEIYFVYSEIKLARRNLKKWMQKKKVSSPFFNFYSKSYYQYQPYGQVLIMGPWNYPVQLTLGPLVSALSAGNVAVVKPSEKTPQTAKIIAKVIQDAFKQEQVICINGGVDAAQELLKHRFNKIFFTGSTSVGLKIAEQAAKTLTPVTLELGGKSPCVIDQSADLELACENLLRTKIFNAGQTCVAPDYVCIEASLEDDFKKTMTQIYNKVYKPHPIEAWSSKIINEQHFTRLEKLVANSDPSKVIIFSKDSFKKHYFPLSLVFDITWDDPIMQEEIFGPILPVIKFSSLDTLLSKFNQLEKPLSLSVFAKDKIFIKKIVQNTQSGVVDVNSIMKSVSNINLPFGGVGHSGMGSSHGFFGFKSFSYTRSLTYKIGQDLFALQPAYSKFYKMIRKFLS
ncbi:MAG TPA: aldehyde dehydrogenase family protein [Oligoflexia bacterium]|nr:aldehyde dehydrogenase family protein [Oligoflexia bacterium]HMR24872.1 aldehyde dehydrogenase family protein [Oligoflexia bacterium]